MAGLNCITIISNDFIPFMRIIPSSIPGQYRYVGIAADIIRMVADHYGYCYNFTGKPTDTYQNTVEKLNRSEGDISGALLSVTLERTKINDFTIFYSEETRLMQPRPVVSSDIAGFIRPFTGPSWLLIFLSLMAIYLMTKIILKGTDVVSTFHQQRNDRMKEHLISSEDSLLWTLQVTFAQAVTMTRSESSVRVIIGFWYLAAFILITVYRSNLKAMLIAPRIVIPFNSLEEFIQTDYKLFVIHGSLLDQVIKDAPEEEALGKMRKQIWTDSNQGVALSKMVRGEFGAAAVRTGIAATLALDFSLDAKCDLYMASQGFFGPLNTAYAFPKNSTLKPIFDKAAHRLREFGILARLVNKALGNATYCMKPVHTGTSASNELRNLSIEDFYGVFSLYAGCIICSCLVFVLERLILPKDKLDLLPEASE